MSAQVGKEIDEWVPLEMHVHMPEETAKTLCSADLSIVLKHTEAVAVNEVLSL